MTDVPVEPVPVEPVPVEPAGPRRRGAPRGHGISARWWIAGAAVVVAAIAVIAFVSYGHLGPSGTPAQKMTSWVAASGFSQNVGSLHDDGVHLEAVLAQHKGTLAVHTVCGVMSVDAQTGNTKLPSPDTELNQILARAYALDYDAATDCYAAGADNTKLLARSADERAEAQRLFVEALARIATVDGRTVSTTTTTSPTTTSASIFG